MRVSRTRFSKRRSKRKTEFPIIAVVQKKRKVDSAKPHSFSMLTKGLARGSKVTPKVTQAENMQLQGNKKEVQSKERGRTLNKKQIFEGDGEVATKIESKNVPPSLKRTATPFSTGEKRSRATIDYKNVILLRNLITAEGKILPRRINKLTAKQQRYVQKAIKSARIMGLVPFINKSRPF